METLGLIPDIPTFDGELVPVSRNPLTSGMRPLQLLPLPGTEFPVRYQTSQMRGFQTESACAATVVPRRKELRDATSCVTQLFCGRTVPWRDGSSMRQGLGQLRDAAVEMRGAAMEMRVAAYPYKQCRPLHGRAPEVSVLLELRDAAKSAVTQSVSTESEETSSELGLIGSKNVDLVTKSSKLGLIGSKGFDLATSSALSAPVDLEKTSSRLGLIGPKDVGFTVMSQLPEIPASAYTWETLGALPDIPTFDGEPMPVSRNPLTPGPRPLQPLPLPGTEFPVRYEMSRMHGFRSEVNLGKARSGGSTTDASAFCDLLDPSMRARVVAAGFGDYAPGERWNDCTHTFVFGFGEMSLTPMDYAVITGLRFTGPASPLDARYQTATLGA
ncbi:hypothetical protein JCGZ_18552 [Jatropha curcas]|uniref:Uncharacterized protein n=1 Tax=Jatropha curcas TaxID=180498 RepID=A0A067K1Q9_JATCU|nr:hypothetical protein JCGZ_18552 [Jatropha curcas]